MSPGHTAASRDYARLIPWLLALAAFGAVVAAIGPWPVGVFQDDGIYVVLAKSLATGEGYRYLNIPGAPNATHYPPLFPAWLALLWKVSPSFPQNVTLFKFANAVWLGASAALFYAFARRWLRLTPVAAALGVALFTACAPVVLLSVMVLSEPMFLCLLAATLLACERAASSGRVSDAMVAGAAAAVLALVRTLGILVVPATVLVLAARRQWRAAFALGATAVVLSIPWQLWVGAHALEVPEIYLGKYGSYLGWLVGAVRRDGVVFLGDVAWANLKSLVAQGWASTATDTLNVYVRNTTSIALAFFFGLGMGGLARRTPATAIFLVMYLGIVVIWPFAPARFTWGVWPLVGLVFTLSVVSVWEWGAPPKNNMPSDTSTDQTISAHTGSFAREASHSPPSRFLRPLALASLAALAVGYGGYNALGVSRDWWGVVQGSVANRARPLAEWVVANTDSNAVVATDDDVLIHLYTGRRAIPNGAFTPQEHLVAQTPAFAIASLRTILSTYHVDYVLASTQYGTYAVRGLVQAAPSELRIVRALSSGAIFAPVQPGIATGASR
ncbi:MAG: glycosyltransferase family 39 protein [Gemmatimonadaceae bacterium]|nr:glycosyltransferase family 39 protein [Gemmatimonadaceae bacterium]